MRKIDPESPGAKLTEILDRAKREMDRNAASALIGVRRQTLNRYESGQTVVPKHRRERIAAVLGVSPRDIWNVDNLPRETSASAEIARQSRDLSARLLDFARGLQVAPAGKQGAEDQPKRDAPYITKAQIAQSPKKPVPRAGPPVKAAPPGKLELVRNPPAD